MRRIKKHPILQSETRKRVNFFFNGRKLSAFEGEILSSALFANGIKIFGYHRKDDAPQGIFCANGQCAQCSVMVDGKVEKACITKVRPEMMVEQIRGEARCDMRQKLPALHFAEVEDLETDVLIIGAGPAGLSAATELGKLNVPAIVVDDKHKLGGKLVLQTHKFFGSVEDCYAGTRGIHIAERLAAEVKKYPSLEIWLNSVCLGIFSDKKAGILKEGKYCLVRPKAVVVAAGAREKFLPFPGSTLPGVYGAGAFQTLVNRDMVKPSENIFVLGGGNVGLIAAYHALQAGINVVGLAEAMPSVGGYKVHADKIKRLGVPIYTSHTVERADGKNFLESVTIVEVDENFRKIKGSRKTFKADTLLIAVGLREVSEFFHQARAAGLKAFSCGDCQEIAEASAAMFSGKIAAHKTLNALSVMTRDVPEFWEDKLKILKSKPGRTFPPDRKKRREKIYPVIHCRQEIPCDPCVTVCPKKSIKLRESSIMSLPYFEGECIGCLKCLIVCPGLAITVVDRRKNPNEPFVYIPLEMSRDLVETADKLESVDEEGNPLGKCEVAKVINQESENMLILQLKAKGDIADKIVSVRLFRAKGHLQAKESFADENPVICRCERVREKEIRKILEEGITDLNQIKALTRAAMGACGGKTCRPLVKKLAEEYGAVASDFTDRPPFMKVALGQFSNFGRKDEEKRDDWGDF